jgi:hypothetical protein
MVSITPPSQKFFWLRAWAKLGCAAHWVECLLPRKFCTAFLDPAWSCNASAKLKIIAQKEGKEDHERETITHVFNAKENDWGWARIMKFEVYTYYGKKNFFKL